MESSRFLPEKYDFSNVDIDTSIEEFFSKEEYKNMCYLEKKRYKNLRLNYEMMLQFGLPAQKPDFMKPRRGIPRQTENDDCRPDSDEEWRPRAKRKPAPKTWRPPFRPPSATVTSAHSAHQTAGTSAGKDKRKTRQKAEKPKEEPRQYSFRKRKEVNYMTLEVPNDDEFIYCEDCDQEFQGDCPEHGPFHVVDDIPVEVKKRGDPQRAMKTLPPGLEVRESGIPNAGLGVFATQFFPTRSRFGPYEGRRVTDPDIAHSSGYCWQISTDEGYSYFVDAKDCKTANWMRYVNCARTRSEQNVTAYQHCGEVYYRAHCDIQPGTEVLVWYGREYGKELGIIREDDEPKSKRRSHVTHLEAAKDKACDEHLTCSDSDVRTSDIEFSDSDDSDSHQKKKPKMLMKLDQPSCSATTTSARHPPSTNRPSLPTSATTSGSLLSLDSSHVCQRCSAVFVLFSSLKLHMNFVHREKLHLVLPVPSIPDRCGAGNHGDSNMEKEKKVVNASNGKGVERSKHKTDNSHAGEKDERKSRRHVCDVCNKAFTLACDLKTHKLIHTSHKPFVCDVCSKAFTLAGHLKTHKLIHTGHKQFVCDVCNKAFTLAGHLKTHKLIHTGHEQFVCDVCNKAFTQAGHLKRHKLIHTGHKQFVCDVCNKAFTEADTLKRHKLIHTGHKQFVCDVCSKAFTEAGHLKRHKRIHTGERPYTCPHCDADFNVSSTLQRHIRSVHAGDRPYVCDVCGKAFSQTGHFEQHKRIHTGEKPYVCTDCGRGFTSSTSLKTHQLTHTGEKPHTCPHCPFACTRSRDLKKHIQRLHQ